MACSSQNSLQPLEGAAMEVEVVEGWIVLPFIAVTSTAENHCRVGGKKRRRKGQSDEREETFKKWLQYISTFQNILPLRKNYDRLTNQSKPGLVLHNVDV